MGEKLRVCVQGYFFLSKCIPIIPTYLTPEMLISLWTQVFWTMMEIESTHVQKRSNSSNDDVVSGQLTLIPHERPAADLFPAHCSENQGRSTGPGQKGQHMWKHSGAFTDLSAVTN